VNSIFNLFGSCYLLFDAYLRKIFGKEIEQDNEYDQKRNYKNVPVCPGSK